MGLPKGTTNNLNGRPKGTPNKATSKTREAFNQLIEDNIANLSIWITKVAAEDPKAALDVIAKLAEYTTPKLARTETQLEIQDKKQFFLKPIPDGK
jgi:hypothetical protein